MIKKRHLNFVATLKCDAVPYNGLYSGKSPLKMPLCSYDVLKTFKGSQVSMCTFALGIKAGSQLKCNIVSSHPM